MLFNKFKVNISILLSIVLLYTMPTFCYFYNCYNIKNDINNSITVTGDSYAGWFATFECYKDYDIIIYAEPGKSTEENLYVMEDAINSPSKILLISIGVNDHHKKVPLDEFKNRLNYLVSLCEFKGKKVFLHSYMNYQTSVAYSEYPYNLYNDQVYRDFFDYIKPENDSSNKYEISDYDNAIREVCNAFSNAYFIDMSDYNNEKYLQQDKIHYDKLFYDALYDRLSMSLFLLKLNG